VQADATDEAVLKELGVSNFDVAIVTIGEAIQNSVLCAILLKSWGPYVIARAENDLHGTILDKSELTRLFTQNARWNQNAHGLT